MKLSSTSGRYEHTETYSSRGIQLPEKVKTYIEQLQSEGEYIDGAIEAFTEQEASVMSRETGVEYTRVTIGDKAYLIRGTDTGVTIPEQLEEMLKQSGGTLDFHTHPNAGDIIPSKDDMETMEMLEGLTGQKSSRIVATDGKESVFTKSGVSEISTVRSHVSEDYEKIIAELFGGGEQG